MKKGFTLIELLGVIIIISILLILIVPNVNKAIQNSAKNVFKRNVQAIYNYVSKDVIDNEKTLPVYYFYDSDGLYDINEDYYDDSEGLSIEDAYGFVTVTEDGIINVGISYREDYCATNFMLDENSEEEIRIPGFWENFDYISGNHVKDVKLIEYKNSSCEAQSDIPNI